MAKNEIEQVNRIDKNANVNTDTVVVTSENGKDKVLDFIEYVETSDDKNAIKIRNLRKYLSDRELNIIYQYKAGTLTSEEELAKYLGRIFLAAAKYINRTQNDIVIDLETGLKDPNKSAEKAVQNGIYAKEKIEITNEEIIKILTTIGNEGLDNEEIDYIFKNLGNDFFDFEDSAIAQLFNDDDYLNQMINDEKTPEILKKKLKENNNTIVPYTQKYNKHIHALCYYQYRISNAKSFEIEAIQKEMNEYIANNTDCEIYAKDPLKLPIYKEDGTIDEDFAAEMNGFIKACKENKLISHIVAYENFSEEIKASLSKKDKLNILKYAFVGLHDENTSDVNKNISERCKKIIKEIAPDLDLSNEKKLAAFVKEEFGFKGDFEKIPLEQLIEIINTQYSYGVENEIIKKYDNYLTQESEISQSDVNFNKRKLDDSILQNYFMESKVEFSEEDEKNYNDMYKMVTVDSWIESKEEAKRLRYKALITVRDEYIKNPSGGNYTKNKLKEIEKEIKIFEQEYGKIDFTEKENGSFGLFREQFVAAGITKYLTRDARKWGEEKDYADLDSEEKKEYIRTTLVALKNGNPNFYLTKIALRRLELMNTKEKVFVEIKENGEYELNEELILAEYKGMSDYKYSSFEELVKSAELRENEYLLKKLGEYTKLNEKDFVPLENRGNYEESMKKIEKARLLSNAKRVDQIVHNAKIKNDKELIINSPYEKDIHLFEICKLHRELRDPKNVEHTQMYNLKLAEIKAFYEKYSEYKGKKLPILNEDGTLNDAEVEKMEQYSEAYQRIVIFKKLEELKKFEKEGFEKIPKETKQKILLCSFAGLKFRDSDDPDIQRFTNNICMKVINKLCPDLDLNNEKELAEFFKKEIGFKGNIKTLSLDELVDFTSSQVKEATELFIEKDQENYADTDKTFASLDLDASKRKIHKSTMKNYFVESKIEFNEQDEKKYNAMYKHVTVDSWIDNKDNAIKLKYAALNTIRDEYSNTLKDKQYVEDEELKKIDEAINELKDKYKHMDFSKKNEDVDFEKYRKQFINADVTKHLTRDASNWSDGIDYKNSDEKYKEEYIRYILIALDNKGKKDFFMTKIALRRLELMNSDDKEFFKVNERGGYEINKKLILNEYQKVSKNEYLNYDEMVQSVKSKENKYILEKLDEYTKLDANDFVPLKNRKNYDGSMIQIENARYKSNQKKIHEMFQQEETKEEPKAETKSEEKSLEEIFDEKVQDGTMKEEDLNFTVERPEYTEKSSNQEEPSVDREDAQGEQNNKGIVAESIDDSAVQKTEAKEESLPKKEDIKSKNDFAEKVKKAINTVKNFFEERFGNKRKQDLLGDGTEKSTNSVSDETGNSIKTGSEKFMEAIAVTNKPTIQESQNLSQSEAQNSVDRNVDDDSERV